MTEKGPTTRKDVADRAGVSLTSVSSVLNDRRYVSDEIREKVLKAVSELGYSPNLVARGLKTGKTHQIGLIIGNITNPFVSELMVEISRASGRAGYDLIVFHVQGREHTDLQRLLQRQVDGMLFIDAPGILSKEKLEVVLSGNVPCMSHLPTHPQIPSVTLDFQGGMRRIVHYLADLGHRKIGFLAGSRIGSLHPRYEGYVLGCAERGISVLPDYVVDGEYEPFFVTVGHGFRAMQDLLGRSTSVTAVICFNDIMAMGALSAITSSGLRVPEDISVVGWDNIPSSTYTIPPLTTVGCSLSELADQLIYGLVREMKGEDCASLKLPVDLLIRQSVRAVF